MGRGTVPEGALGPRVVPFRVEDVIFDGPGDGSRGGISRCEVEIPP